MMHLDLSRPTAQPRYQHLRLFFIIACVSYVTVLGFFSLTPSVPGPANLSDKALHFIAYGGLTGLLGLALPQSRLGLLFVLASAIGLALECAQGYFPVGRVMSMSDQAANMGGVMLAISAWIAIAATRKQPSKTENLSQL